MSVLCNNAEVKHLIMNDMIMLGKDAGLKSFENVRLRIKALKDDDEFLLFIYFVG